MLLLVSLAVLLLNGCGKTASNKTTTTNATASPKATAEVSKSPSGTSVGTKISTPDAAANGLLEAWKTKDESEAAKYATEAAFKKLFKEGDGPEGLSSQGCSDEDKTYDCAYTYEGGALIMHVKGDEAAGYKVDSIEFIAD
jgi:hypothetical protein